MHDSGVVPAPTEHTALLVSADDRSKHQQQHHQLSPTRIAGTIVIVLLILNSVTLAETAQSLQTTSNYRKPFFLMCFNHTSTIVLLPLVYLYHRHYDAASGHKEGLDFLSVLQRHAVLPLRKLCIVSFLVNTVGCSSDYFLYAGLSKISVGAGTAIYNTTPMFVYCLSVCFLHESVSLRKLLGVLVAFTGVALVGFFQDTGDSSSGSIDFGGLGLLGGILVLSASATNSIYEVGVVAGLGEDLEDTTTLLIVTGLYGLVSIPVWIVGTIVFNYGPWTSMYEPLGWPDTNTGVALFSLEVVLFCGNATLMLLAVCWTSPIETAVGCMLSIPVAGLWDTVFRHTHFSWECIVGSIMVMMGFGILEYTKVRAAIRGA